MILEKVTIEDTPEKIVQAIIALAQKERNHACDRCMKEEPDAVCKDCMQDFYSSRNCGIRILRNIFDLPKMKDVPKPIFHLVSEETNNIIAGIVSDRFRNGIEKFKALNEAGKLTALVPPDITCPECKAVVSPSRFGYVSLGRPPVCWDCEVKRSEA